MSNAGYLPDGQFLSRNLKRLELVAQGDCGTREVQTKVREFLKCLPHYRSYLCHPHLGLPCATNTVECMGRLPREMFRSSRAGSNPASVRLWATALIRTRPNVNCNGHSINGILTHRDLLTLPPSRTAARN